MWRWEAPVIGWICRRSETNGPCQESIHKRLIIAKGNSRSHEICNYRCMFLNENAQLGLEWESFIVYSLGQFLVGE